LTIFNPKNFSFKNNKLNNIELYFKIPINNDITKIKSLISHELTHVIEFYNLIKNNKEIPKHSKLKINLNKFKSDYEYENYFDAFLHYIYLTLDNEFNAIVSELYFYLKDKNTNNEDELNYYLENSYIWKKIKEIDIFSNINFGNFLINKLGEESVIVFLDLFNKSLDENLRINLEIKNKEDIFKYLKKWETIFKIKNKKHKLKCFNIIKEVIKDYD